MTAQEKYVQQVLQEYLNLPDTGPMASVSDRKLAERLFEQGISIEEVEGALLVASARRLFSKRGLHNSRRIYSLHYFIPVIMEITENCFPEGYLDYLRRTMGPYLKSKIEKVI